MGTRGQRPTRARGPALWSKCGRLPRSLRTAYSTGPAAEGKPLAVRKIKTAPAVAVRSRTQTGDPRANEIRTSPGDGPVLCILQIGTELSAPVFCPLTEPVTYRTTMASTATGPGPRLTMLMVCFPEVRPVTSQTTCWAWRVPVVDRSAVARVWPSI